MSILSRITYSYLDHVVFHAYRTKDVAIDDMPPLPEEERIEILAQRVIKVCLSCLKSSAYFSHRQWHLYSCDGAGNGSNTGKKEETLCSELLERLAFVNSLLSRVTPPLNYGCTGSDYAWCTLWALLGVCCLSLLHIFNYLKSMAWPHRPYPISLASSERGTFSCE